MAQLPEQLAKQLHDAIEEVNQDGATHTFKLTFWTRNRDYVDHKIFNHGSDYNVALNRCAIVYLDGMGWSLVKIPQKYSGENPANKLVVRADEMKS
jgi:hypothetical protein